MKKIKIKNIMPRKIRLYIFAKIAKACSPTLV